MAHAGGHRRHAILIAGATASGKSALALRLARQLGGRVINADSMQVYGDLSILTARPNEAESSEVPHRLYGMVDGAEAYSVNRWLADATAEIRQARVEGALPIVVGGTGLYFKALTQGLSDLPAVPDTIRAEVRRRAAGQPVEALHRELASRDPETAARLRPTDPQRILRALEILEATGESLAALQERRAPPAIELAACIAVALAVDRDTLRARVDSRFDRMMEAGALNEVRTLATRRLDPILPVMRAIGVPSLMKHLAGEMTGAAAITEAKAATRQYIKRQETFYRHQLPGFRRATSDAAETMAMAEAYS